MLRALLLTLLLASAASAFQWGFDPPGPEGHDLVVEATLLRSDASIVRAHGALYERSRSTLLVHRVLYRDAEVPAPGATVELYVAHQRMPWIPHGREAFQRGVWLLSRSEQDGLWTANSGWPRRALDTIEASEPRASLVGGWFDAETGEAELAVRYENFGPGPAVVDEVSFDAEGRPRGLGLPVTFECLGRDRLEVARAASPEASSGQVSLSPWTFVRRSVRLVVPEALRARDGVWLRHELPRLPRVRDPISGAERAVIDLPLGLDRPKAAHVRPRTESCRLYPRGPARAERSDDLPPPWLAPSSPQWTVLAWPPVWVVALALVGGAATAQARRATPRARRAALRIVTGAAALLPWSLLGPGPFLLEAPPPAASLLLSGLVFALLARPLSRRGISHRAFGRALLVPPLMLIAAHVALGGWR